MASTTYIDFATPAVNAAWLNDVNTSTYSGPVGYLWTGTGVGTFGAWTPPMILQNSQSAAYQIVASDVGKHILHPSADVTARIWTIPSNATLPLPIGSAITFVNQNAAGIITISITSDTMRIAGTGTTGNRLLAANGIATALKITATEWIISGTGLS